MLARSRVRIGEFAPMAAWSRSQLASSLASPVAGSSPPLSLSPAGQVTRSIRKVTGAVVVP